MARARNIKPGFFTNDQLVELPFETRLLFIGLWTLADKAGRLEDRPKKIKMELFPADNVDVGPMLNDLRDCGFIKRYAVDGVAVIQIVNWDKHQSPHHTERDSTLPEPLVNGEDTVKQQKQDGGNPPDSLIPDSLIPDSGFTDSSASAKPPPKVRSSSKPEAPEEFEAAWSEYPKRPGNSKQEALKAWGARVKAGVDPVVMLEGVRRYAAFCEAQRTEPQFIKQASTFFGPSEHYLSDWTPQAARASPGLNRQEAIEARNRAVGEEWLRQEGFAE